MADLIDRQAAIDAIADYIHNVDKVVGTGKLSAHDCKDAARSVLDELPSAQPEIVRCKDCKHWTDENNCYCDIWDYYISNDEFFCGCGERRSSDEREA